MNYDDQPEDFDDLGMIPLPNPWLRVSRWIWFGIYLILGQSPSFAHVLAVGSLLTGVEEGHVRRHLGYRPAGNSFVSADCIYQKASPNYTATN